VSYIYGFLFNIVTFPGQIFRVLAYRFMCDLLKVKVYEVRYFKGILVHGPIANLRKAFLISIAPLFLNTLLCMVLTFPAVFPFLIGDSAVIWPIFLAWLGLSLGVHAFPQRKIIESFIDAVDGAKSGGVFYMLCRTFAFIMSFVNFLRFFWFDLVYAVAVAAALPFLLLHVGY
jgi:hypothetical protein